ncbi:MAG: hypothetical protein Q9216_002497 [Gyalolechia sp. 2 TL-2023]
MSQEKYNGNSASLPTSTSTLIFPAASLNLSKSLSAISRSSHSVINRLASIDCDSVFVQKVAHHYKLPLVANERCGTWYIPPELRAGSAYFKSTDGHQGQWRFSSRRLNLQVLDIVGKNGGCILVDSTRRGKSMPDALSKTVPVWCAVMNRLLFKPEHQDLRLYTPEDVVSLSEHAQIEARLDRFLDEAKRLQLDLSALRRKISKPLRPVWITPDTFLPDLSTQPFHHPIICLTASRLPSNPDDPSNAYIQGAADDSEFWFRGLAPAHFWEHRKTLLLAAEDELSHLIQSLLDAPQTTPTYQLSPVVLIKPTESIYIAPIDSLSTWPAGDWDAIVICAPSLPLDESEEIAKTRTDQPRPKILHLHCPKGGKLGSRALRSHLHRVSPFIESILLDRSPQHPPQAEPPQPKILFACLTGTDLAAGAALVALCLCIDEDGKLSKNNTNNMAGGNEHTTGGIINKVSVRRRLAWITQSKSDANPSRETLKAVNSCLIGR